MKHSRGVFVPAVVVALAGFALIFYAWFGVSRQGLPGIKPGDRGNEELFKTLGTIAVWSTALSYAWLRVKRKRKSPSPLVKKLVKLFDKAHRLAGYAAIVLIAVHGLYFLTQARIKDDTYTGIAGFALLLSLGMYGFLIRRVKNKHLRKIHFLLATVFAVVAVIHAGGSAIIAILSTIVFWGLVWLIERRVAQSTENRAA